MRRTAVLIALALTLAIPAAATAAADDASACGQYHGLFGAPPGGGAAVANAASSGLFKDGVVGELNSNPACHS